MQIKPIIGWLDNKINFPTPSQMGKNQVSFALQRHSRVIIISSLSQIPHCLIKHDKDSQEGHAKPQASKILESEKQPKLGQRPHRRKKHMRASILPNISSHGVHMDFTCIKKDSQLLGESPATMKSLIRLERSARSPRANPATHAFGVHTALRHWSKPYKSKRKTPATHYQKSG